MINSAKKNVVLMVSGSIGAFKAASLASLMVKNGWDVQCISTEGGRYFIGDAALEGLTGKKVLKCMFEPGRALDHITLADWAEHLVLYPASANRITRLHAGLADDLIGALFLANNFRKPWWLAPAMNSNMYQHPAVHAALEQLSSWGARIMPTGEGWLACGTVGYGRLLEPEDALALLENSD